MNPPWLQESADEIRLALRIQPRASRTEVAAVVGDTLKIRVAAPPVDDAANRALLRFLADQLDCPKSAVRLLRGRSGRQKIVAIQGVSAEHARRRLTPKQ
jgi:uncharacterized protein (TIGR00251 family)